MKSLRIATCRPLPEPDVDEDLLLEALRSADIDARMVAWHDEAAWSDPVPTVIRSTWDYIHRLDVFSQWVRHTAAVAPLWNPPEVVLGNLHKRYLLELESRGVPVTPTLLLTAGSALDFAEACELRGWQDVVVKPAVGAGSFETHRLDPRQGESATRVRTLGADRDLLVQPYLRSVDGYGERALVWIDGEFTHAVRKSPRFSGGVESVSEALPLSPEERALGEAAIAAIVGSSIGATGTVATDTAATGASKVPDLLYGRVDVAPGPDGLPVVMELELVEPSLFLLQQPPALQRLVAAITRRLASADDDEGRAFG